MIQSVTFGSKATQDLSEQDLLRMSQKIEKRNRELDVSGFLYFRQGTFLQHHEGDKDAVERIMEAVQQDPRHQIVRVVEGEQRPERLFKGWALRYVRPGDKAPLGLEDVLRILLIDMARGYSVAEVTPHVQRVIGLLSRAFSPWSTVPIPRSRAGRWQEATPAQWSRDTSPYDILGVGSADFQYHSSE